MRWKRTAIYYRDGRKSWLRLMLNLSLTGTTIYRAAMCDRVASDTADFPVYIGYLFPAVLNYISRLAPEQRMAAVAVTPRVLSLQSWWRSEGERVILMEKPWLMSCSLRVSRLLLFCVRENLINSFRGASWRNVEATKLKKAGIDSWQSCGMLL